MVSSAVLGAASGTGLALVLAMTLLICRYYALSRRNKDWGDLERFGDPSFQSFGADWKKVKKKKRKRHRGYMAVDQTELHITSEQHAVQPRPTALSPHFATRTSGSPVRAHQPLSGATAGGPLPARASSQSSLESSVSRQGHDGSSPQIRQFAPDVRSTPLHRLHSSPFSEGCPSANPLHSHLDTSSDVGLYRSLLHHPYDAATSEVGPYRSPYHHHHNSAASEAGPSTSRPPSQVSYYRATSLDIRSSSPPGVGSSTDSTTRTSGTSLADRYVSSLCNAPVLASPLSPRSAAQSKSISPLLIPTSPLTPRSAAHSRSISPLLIPTSPLTPRSAAQSRSISPLLIPTSPLTPRSAAQSRSISPLLIPASPLTPRSAAQSRSISPLQIPASPHQPPAPPTSPLGTIPPDLYELRGRPMFIRNYEIGNRLGRIRVHLNYDFDKSDLLVHIVEALDLVRSDQRGFNQPYVRLTLEPLIDDQRRETSVHKSEVKPFLDDHFQFSVAHEELWDKTLVLQVFDFDHHAQNDVIGEARVNLKDIDLINDAEVWADIYIVQKPREDTQEVLVSLSYLPQAERLTVVVVKARNLVVPEGKKRIDPFAKVYLLSDGKRLKKKRTSTQKDERSPKWHEPLTYRIPYARLQHTCLEIIVMDQTSDLLGKDALLGCCVIGPMGDGPGRKHWNEMKHHPLKAASVWHALR